MPIGIKSLIEKSTPACACPVEMANTLVAGGRFDAGGITDDDTEEGGESNDDDETDKDWCNIYDEEIEVDRAILDKASTITPSDEVPAMPCVESASPGGADFKRRGHRTKNADKVVPFNACVARPVGKKEMLDNPKASAAMKAEKQSGINSSQRRYGLSTLFVSAKTLSRRLKPRVLRFISHPWRASVLRRTPS